MFFNQRLLYFIVMIKTALLDYAGEDFPVKYLDPDEYVPTDSDLYLYLDRLFRLTDYWLDHVNDTDTNEAFAAFMSVAVLKRTLRDNRDKMKEYEESIKILIHDLSSVVAHYRYEHNNENKGGWRDPLYRVSKVMQDDTSTVYSLGKFTKGILRAWLLNVYHVNEFAQAMDVVAFPKEKYVELVTNVNEGGYEMDGIASDLCLTRLVENVDVLDNTTLHPCKMDHFCRKKIFTGSSVAYSLSHKLFNNMMYIHTRRCYHYSSTFDISHMEMLCAAMYRETVYLARRGFFARDLFLEHIAFCGQLGYEEFYRHKWFQKLATWIDEEGCMQDDHNFIFNGTKISVGRLVGKKQARELWRIHQEIMENDCHQHQMALATVVFANAIRYTAHKMNPVNSFRI